MASNDKEKSVATELTAGSDSAATEHTEEPQLAELVNQEAGLATEIELKVIRNDLVDYMYPFNGKQVPTQKVQIVLQSKVADQYCLGVAKLQRKNKTELKQVQDCFEEMASQAASLGFLDSDGKTAEQACAIAHIHDEDIGDEASGASDYGTLE